jgi:hypothetical protein
MNDFDLVEEKMNKKQDMFFDISNQNQNTNQTNQNRKNQNRKR